MNLPNSMNGLELNWTALLLAIFYPEPLTPEQALEAIYKGQKPEPVRFTPDRKTIERAVTLQQRGLSLTKIKTMLDYQNDVSSLCRQIRKFRHDVLLDFSERNDYWTRRKDAEYGFFNDEQKASTEEASEKLACAAF